MNAPSSTDCLLALSLDQDHLNGTRLYNPESSLPVPHITLLHGFVTLHSAESRFLASQAVEEVVRSVLGDGGCYRIHFDRDSLTLFEHRESATVVAVPSLSCPENDWILQLYQALRQVFRTCNEQEARFASGWTPHGKSGE